VRHDDMLGWNPEDGWILSLRTKEGGISWSSVDARRDEHVVKLAALLVGRAELAGMTKTLAVQRDYRPIGWIQVEDGSIVGVASDEP
jgi:hypothetical protein